MAKTEASGDEIDWKHTSALLIVSVRMHSGSPTEAVNMITGLNEFCGSSSIFAIYCRYRLLCQPIAVR